MNNKNFHFERETGIVPVDSQGGKFSNQLSLLFSKNVIILNIINNVNIQNIKQDIKYE